MLDAYVEGAASESLETQLKYTIPPTSSAVVAKREATIFSSGGDSYSSVNGVRACTFRIQAENQFLDPSSLYFKATLVNDSGAILSFKAPFFSCIQRCSLRLGSTLIEDVNSFGRLYSLLHTLSDPEDQKMMSVSAGDGPDGALGATGTTIGVGGSGKFGFPLGGPMALPRCGKLIPIGLAGLEVTLELVPAALTFASTADQAANASAWHLNDCQCLCSILQLDSQITEQVHKHTLQGRSLPLVLPGTWFCVDQTSSANATIHISRNCSRAEKLLVTYTGAGDDEVIDFAKPTGTGTVEVLLGSRRLPDRALEWDDTPAQWDLLQKCVGKGQKLNITRHQYMTQTSGRKSFVLGFGLTKSPGDGVDGQVSFTGENMRTSSLCSIQQKGAGTVDRIWCALQYTALVEIEAGGVSLSE